MQFLYAVSGHTKFQLNLHAPVDGLSDNSDEEGNEDEGLKDMRKISFIRRLPEECENELLR